MVRTVQEMHAVRDTRDEWRAGLDAQAERQAVAEEVSAALDAGERRVQERENQRGRLERQRSQVLQRMEDARPYAESRFPSRARTGAQDTVARCRRELVQLDAKLAELR